MTGAASSPLPIINTNIALSGFYWVAPLILLGVYFYLHLYLQRLWGDLASLPAVFPDGEALDRKAYPWLLNGLVRAHFARLKLGDRPLSRLENLVSIALAWWVVPVILILFWLRYLPRHEWWGTGLHVALITLAVGFGVRSYRLAVRTLSGADEPSAPGQDPPLWAWIWRGIRSYRPDKFTTLALYLAVVFSVGPTLARRDNLDGHHDNWDLLTMLRYETYAELVAEDISTKPSSWTGREETADVEVAQVKGADLQDRDLRNAAIGRAFLVKGNFARANLRGADFRDTDLRRASFWKADLRGANLAPRRPPRRLPPRHRPPRRLPPRRQAQESQPQQCRRPRHQPNRCTGTDPGAARPGMRRRQAPAAPPSNADRDVPGRSSTGFALAAGWIVLASPASIASSAR